MSVTSEQMQAWCRKVMGLDAPDAITLAEYIASIPKLESLANVPAGTPVVVASGNPLVAKVILHPCFDDN